MARRSRGEGSVYRRSDGRWAASIQVDGRRRTVYARSEREARARLRALREQAYTRTPVATTRQTLAQLLDTWLITDPAMRETTRAATRALLARCLTTDLTSLRIDRITPEHIQWAYVPLTPSVARRVHANLHRAFEVAVRWRWLQDNPCSTVIRKPYEATPRPLWSMAELQAFLSAIEGFWLAPLYIVLLATGMRIGEALALTWDDVGPGAALNVGSTLQRLNGQPVLNQPKTRAGRRTVLLPPAATAALQAQRAQQNAWRTRAGADWASAGFIFTTKRGGPLNDNTPYAALKRICARADIPVVTLHSLRHLHASLLLGEGIPVPAVSARLGHANAAITMRVYAHQLAGQDQLAAAAIGRALGAPAEEPTEQDPKNI